MKVPFFAATICLCASMTLHAGTRTSVSYTILTDSTDAGGQRSDGGSFTHVGSMGTIGGVATADPVHAGQGYCAQLTEVFGLNFTATPATVDEGGTRQVSAIATYDDFTTAVLSGNDVSWNVSSGPLASISTSGIATAAFVYSNTPATVAGSYLGQSSARVLTVLNVGLDDFGAYAGDQIDDDWQVLYFGQNNPAAAALSDPDGDGQNNRFEFLAGGLPTDPSSRFKIRIEPIIGQPASQDIVFSPITAGRTYIVRSRLDLSSTPTALPGTPPTVTSGGERRVTDTGATGARKFYDVLLSKP